MKNFLPLFLAIISIGCSKDDKSSNSTTSANESLNKILTSGSWHISSFIDSGKDETSDFSSYTFSFTAGGTVVVSHTSNSLNGSWTTGNDDGSLQLILDFGNNVPLENLNEDWKILSQTDLLIELQHISGGNGGTDKLTFNKQ